MLFLDLDEAIKVLKYNVSSFQGEMDDDDWEYIRTELEQKCFFTSKEDTIQRITSLAMDINPKEIAAQIEDDKLGRWCENMQAEFTACVLKAEVEDD